jgi:putative hemolysin
MLKEPMAVRPLATGESLDAAWGTADIVLPPVAEPGQYLFGFAASPRAVEAAQRLRFQVFNLELNEGLAASYVTGLDSDEFDPQMTHLLLMDSASRSIIGTYRLQTGRQAVAGRGFYSAGEYDLTPLVPHTGGLVECGRACIAADHRNHAALLTLWQGIAVYTRLSNARWLFGCCSVTSICADDGWRTLMALRQINAPHPELWLKPVAECDCGDPAREHDPELGPPLKIPKLFRTYLRLGARVISAPAIDRAFGTVDFLILMDTCSETFCNRVFRKTDAGSRADI